VEASYHIHNDIVDRCLAGDRTAYEELYRLYEKAMYSISLRITNDEDDAQDVLQEAFVSAFQYLNTYNKSASFGAWLKRIVVNKSINLIKKRKIELTQMTDDVDLPEEEDEYNSDFSVSQVKQAIKLLPDGYRTIFSLYLLEGYDHREISQILGITESTSKSQFNRSKKKLITILKQEVVYERG